MIPHKYNKFIIEVVKARRGTLRFGTDIKTKYVDLNSVRDTIKKVLDGLPPFMCGTCKIRTSCLEKYGEEFCPPFKYMLEWFVIDASNRH